MYVYTPYGTHISNVSTISKLQSFKYQVYVSQLKEQEANQQRNLQYIATKHAEARIRQQLIGLWQELHTLEIKVQALDDELQIVERRLDDVEERLTQTEKDIKRGREAAEHLESLCQDLETE